MANEISRLFVTIGADTSEFQTKIQGMSGVLKNAGIGIASFGLAAVGAGLATAKAFASTADNLDEMSTRTGVSTTTLQELQYAAKLTGSSLEGMEGGIKRMQSAISDGSAEVAAFGLDLTTLQGLPVAEQFQKIADVIAGIADPTQRANIAMAIFGRSGTHLIPMLAGGSQGLKEMAAEANSLGIIMDETSVKGGATFQDGMDKLEMALGGVVNQIGAALIPVLTPLIPLFMDLIKALPLKEFGELLGKLLPPLVAIFIKLMDAIPLDVMMKFVEAALIPVLNILTALLPILEPILELFGTLLEILTPVLDVIGAILTGVAQILGSGIGGIVGGISGGLSGVVDSFATGGIVSSPTLAMIGEAGPEAVIPLGQLSQGNSEIHTHLYLDGEQIAEVVDKRLFDRINSLGAKGYV